MTDEEERIDITGSLEHDFVYGGCMNEPTLAGWVEEPRPVAAQRRDLNILAARLMPPPPTVWLIEGRLSDFGSTREGVLKPQNNKPQE